MIVIPHHPSRSHGVRGARFVPRRGVVAVQVIFMLGAIFTFAALTVDIGRLYMARGELQAAADAAALAGASALGSDDMMKVRAGTSDEIPSDMSKRSAAFAAMHRTLGQTTVADEKDIAVGYLDLDKPDSELDTKASPATFNAVQVTLGRTSDGPNGAIAFQFADVFGKKYGQASETAVAAFDDRFAGYTPPSGKGTLMPLVILKSRFEKELTDGPDHFSFASDEGEVTSGSDGVPEVRLYPEKIGKNGSGDGSGNFGLLNIGNPNQGVPQVEEQILNGVQPEDLEAEIGQPEATFVGEGGEAETYLMTGTPGLKAALEKPLKNKVGDVIGFFLYTSVAGNGANATYTIVDVRFGRLMEVELGGNDKRVVVQPLPYTDEGVRVAAMAPSSGGMVGKLALVR